MDALAALGSGLLAGIGLAAPLGAIGVLLLQEGVARGFRSGAPGAVAVAVVDTLYCSAAILLGALAAPVITGWGGWPGIVGGVALIVIAAIGLRRSLGWGSSIGSQEPSLSLPSRVLPSGRQRFALFLGLTAINPATLVYFTAITVGLASLVSSATTAALFVAGVGCASLSWQLALVAAGALLSGRMTPRARRATSLVGNVVVAGLGLGMLLRP